MCDRSSVASRALGLLCLTVLCLTVIVAMVHAGAAAAAPLDKLAGRWAGYGVIRSASGGTEKIKCVATYFLRQGGNVLEQNLRCSSPSYRIDGRAKMRVRGGDLTGAWRERTYATGGTVAGQTTANGFRLALSGRTFSGALRVNVTSRCRQALEITSNAKVEITGLSVGLARC